MAQRNSLGLPAIANLKNKPMLRAWPYLLRLCLLYFAVSVSAGATGADDAGTKESLDWLGKARLAAEALNYAGTFIFQQGSQVRTSRIGHMGSGPQVLEKLEILDGQPREYLRRGDEITCYLPQEHRLIIQSHLAGKAFPALPVERSEQIAHYYRARNIGSARVVGRDTQVIALEPRDAMRFGYRLWLEKSSGLMLRAQTLSETGDIVEQISFTELNIGNVAPSRLKTSFPNTQGWRIENAMVSKMLTSAWRVKWVPGGFREIQVAKRGLGGSGQAAPRELIQLIYSDGLAGISIFIEPWSPQRSAIQIQQGAINMVGKRHGEFWLTIVGEVPMAAILKVADSIEMTAIK
jgi:sigma-E factor negative regulatory protein RseB